MLAICSVEWRNYLRLSLPEIKSICSERSWQSNTRFKITPACSQLMAIVFFSSFNHTLIGCCFMSSISKALPSVCCDWLRAVIMKCVKCTANDNTNSNATPRKCKINPIYIWQGCCCLLIAKSAQSNEDSYRICKHFTYHWIRSWYSLIRNRPNKWALPNPSSSRWRSQKSKTSGMIITWDVK